MLNDISRLWLDLRDITRPNHLFTKMANLIRKEEHSFVVNVVEIQTYLGNIIERFLERHTPKVKTVTNVHIRLREWESSKALPGGDERENYQK